MFRKLLSRVGGVGLALAVCGFVANLSGPSAYAVGKTPADKKLPVKLAKIGPEDQTGIERQKICPVTDEKLDSMGGPIKVLVGDKPLYLCCKGCVKKVEKDPETYLRKAKGSKSSR